MARVPLGYSVRLAIVKRIDGISAICEYIDRGTENEPVSCPIPHIYAGSYGEGIFIGLQKDVRVLIAKAPSENPYIVGIIPNPELYSIKDRVDIPISARNYPKLKEGEIYIAGPTGSKLYMRKNGDIALDAGIGGEESDIELVRRPLKNMSPMNTFMVRADNTYKFTDAGREIDGVIRRDKNEYEDENQTESYNFLSGIPYHGLLSEIGRSPEDEVQLRTTTISNPKVRNPALVERRNVTYEYADSFNVRGLTNEAQSMLSLNLNDEDFHKKSIRRDSSIRSNRRTDILDLNPRNYNHLIEKVEGTVVDLYGNILDINRNVIRVPDIEELNTTKEDAAEYSLRRLYSYLRRSIKYHFEINSRKELSGTDPSILNTDYNAKSHSRWFVDVDGEGLTKINIPASSETGNIPVLNRHIVSRNEDNPDDGSFKDSEGIDIRSLQFGAKSDDSFSGQSISNTRYKPVSVDGSYINNVGTAFHDLTKVASSIIRDKEVSGLNYSLGGKLRDPEASGGSVVKPLGNIINNTIAELQNGEFYPFQDETLNAGGRSIHANLDGSIEMSVGADTVDRKSLVLDLAGGLVSHYGRDRNGRSIIHQTDGDVIIQVGGPGIEDPRFTEERDTEDRPGRVEIHLNRPSTSSEKANSQRIIIDENGITIDIAGAGVIRTSEDLTISSGGNLLLDGENVYIYGSYNNDIDGDRRVIGKERYVGRRGRTI